MMSEKEQTFNEVVDDLKRQQCFESMVSDPTVVFAHRMSEVIHSLPNGGVRRRKLKELLEVHNIRVNDKHCIQVCLDKDFQRLIKSGEYKIISVHESSTHKKQYLTKVNE